MVTTRFRAGKAAGVWLVAIAATMSIAYGQRSASPVTVPAPRAVAFCDAASNSTLQLPDMPSGSHD